MNVHRNAQKDMKMRKLRIAVFFGGRSSEYSVSLESAYAVLRNLDQNKYEPVPVGISERGQWYYYDGDIEQIRQDRWLTEGNCIPAALSPDQDAHRLLLFEGDRMRTLEIDAAFPVMHGRLGEDGTIQGMIQMAGIPLVGCGVLASALCMDKDRAHKLAALAGVRTPESLCFGREEMEAAHLSHPDDREHCVRNAFRHRADSWQQEVLGFAERAGYPLFVKPVKAGSSYGVTRVSREQELLPAVELAFQYDDQVIVEENIEGFEVGCAVMGNGELTVGEVDEIELAGGFFDYTEKYTLKTSAIHVPARVDRKTAARIKETARVLYRTLGCRGFARVDMFLTPEGEVVFNEINTIPGFTEHSRYPGMMKAAGIGFPELLDRVIGLAVEEPGRELKAAGL